MFWQLESRQAGTKKMGTRLGAHLCSSLLILIACQVPSAHYLSVEWNAARAEGDELSPHSKARNRQVWGFKSPLVWLFQTLLRHRKAPKVARIMDTRRPLYSERPRRWNVEQDGGEKPARSPKSSSFIIHSAAAAAAKISLNISEPCTSQAPLPSSEALAAFPLWLPNS